MIELVLTEQRRDLTDARARNYERLRSRLEEASGMTVHPVLHEEADGALLAEADAIVLSGSSAPWSSRDPDALARLGELVRGAGRPVLGICAGLQLQAMFAGGSVGRCAEAERGFRPVELREDDDLFRELPAQILVFQDHTDEVTELPEGFRVLASSEACAVQAIADPGRRWWGTQFHPEEFDEEHPAGARILRNFFELAL